MSASVWLRTAIGLVALLALLAGVTLIGVWWERKFIGHLQRRRGPLHHGFHGRGECRAEMGRVFARGETVPADPEGWLFQLAPMAAIVPAFAAMAALIWWPGIGLIDMNHGLLYVFAFETLLPLAFALIGWSCANKFTLIGGLRAAAQLISYEIPMLLAALGVVLTAQSMDLTRIMDAQQGTWNVVKQPLGFVIFSIAVLAEMNRSPFDLPEAESELVAGYMTEYSGMKFGFVQLAEYSVLLVGSYLVAALFLGGWWMPFLGASWVWLALKTALLMTSTMWFRGTFPRLRVDTLTELSWKWLLPAALLNVMLVGALALAFPAY